MIAEYGTDIRLPTRDALADPARTNECCGWELSELSELPEDTRFIIPLGEHRGLAFREASWELIAAARRASPPSRCMQETTSLGERRRVAMWIPALAALQRADDVGDLLTFVERRVAGDP
jgi:hypothetical protein